MNIFQIQQNLQELFDTLEENGGEITPEIERELIISQDEFSSKVKDYVAVIKSAKADLNAIAEEEARLKTLKDSKQKLIERLQRILIPAIEKYGDMSKSGTKFVDYGTGKVSIRNTEAVETDDAYVKSIGFEFERLVANLITTNQLDVHDFIEPETLLRGVNSMEDDVTIDTEDLSNVNTVISLEVPLSLLMTEKYDFLKSIVRNGTHVGFKAKVSKTDIKPLLKDGYTSHLAKLKNNKSLTIK